MKESSERDLLKAARRLLRESEHELDELTRAKLRAARLRALDAKPRSAVWRMGAGLVAAGLVVSLAGALWLRAPLDVAAPPASESTVADIDLLVTENPEFYSDLEFYRWLADQPDAG